MRSIIVANLFVFDQDLNASQESACVVDAETDNGGDTILEVGPHRNVLCK